jgi:hypothetical protein
MTTHLLIYLKYVVVSTVTVLLPLIEIRGSNFLVYI